MASASTFIYRKERHAVRVQSELPVRYGAESLDGAALARNISEEGLYIATNDILNVGAEIRLAIALPEEEVHLAGEVVWAIQVPDHLRELVLYGMGIRFVSPDPAWAERFRRWKDGQSDRSPK